MFKLESYITPILLSYVDKYIKNFRPEDSQVSLWGGDVSFHNLDLRLDVLEEELQLPFSIISGHIHELLIHVPWTKLASEPIKITINTIECSLTLRDPENAPEGANVQKEKKRHSHSRKQEHPVVPPGYVQSLINKIVNNITIQCNNLIFKYVEEDIVVSVNIKLLTFQSANEKWQAAYTDISPSQMIMRKLITLSDLTVCLDKRNAAGKIEVYQEPILYRCSVEIRLLRHFLSNKSDKAVNTRLDIYCNKMEFSMTDQQIPMFMRLIHLLVALHQRQLKNENVSDIGSSVYALEDEEAHGLTDTWTGWAWSFAANIFPSEVDADKEWQYTQQRSYLGNTFQCGVYIDYVSLTFRFSEYYSNDKSYYATRKLKYYPFLCLQLTGCYTDAIIGGAEWTSIQMGISEALLLPQGSCSCGIIDISDHLDVEHYFKIGFFNEKYKSNSLFDPQENTDDNSRRNFVISWDYYLATITESVLLEKTPAFAVDFLYHLELPDDFTSEKLSDLGSDLEYSNLNERAICRVILGPFTAHICSGLMHRVSTLLEVLKAYDYSPYKEQPVEPELHELHPPSEDDFDALSNSIPLRIYQITFLKPVFEFQLMNHPKFVPEKGDLFRKAKKSSEMFSVPPIFSRCPSLTFECETFDTKIVMPMYPKRLVYTTCQLPDLPDNMMNASYQHIDVKITGFSSQIVFNIHKKTTILLPINATCVFKSIIFPKYWINLNTVHEEIIIDIDSITVTTTKAKLMVISQIIEKLISLDTGDAKITVFASTLLPDAAKDSDTVILELNLEQLNWKKLQTICTETHSIKINSFKTFLLEPIEYSQDKKPNLTELNQVLIISGPENASCKSENDLFRAVFQFSRQSGLCDHPALVFFNLKEIKMCFDPLLFQWLLYDPKYFNVKNERLKSQPETIIYKPRIVSDVGTSLQETTRRANTPHESIHSSSEKEIINFSSPKPQITVTEYKEPDIDNTYDFLLKWYQLCSNMVIFGDISECTVYFPTKPLSALGAQGIGDLIATSLKEVPQLKIMVVNSPNFTLHTAGQKYPINNYVYKLPVKLPEHIWDANKLSFPWNIEMKNFSCYTLHDDKKLYFLKPLSGNITIGLSLKYKTNMDITVTKKPNKMTPKKKIKNQKNQQDSKLDKKANEISSFSICVYIDNTPVLISLSEMQVRLISSIVNALIEVFNKFALVTSHEKIKFKDDLCCNLQKSFSLSPNFLKEEVFDNYSERTPTSPTVESKVSEELGNNKTLTVWMQWTITKFRIKLYGFDSQELGTFPTLKLVFDMEDIMASYDLQEIYSKFKLKIVSTNIHHYKRKSLTDKWKPGIYFGTIMRNREELPTNEKQEDFGFMSITVTKAKCGHVHNKWGALKKHKLAEMKMEQSTQQYSETRYISEIIATLQPVDFIISPKVLNNFYVVVEPFLQSKHKNKKEKLEPTNQMDCFSNTNLPLAYLDCKGIRIVILCSKLIEKYENHNICIIEIENINLSPSAENPICRNPVRPDIYQQAAQNRILNIPGSDIEDRQYQFNINSLSINTGSWIEFSEMLCRDTDVLSALHTMTENPALQWNNLEWGRMSLIPNLSLLPIIKKFNQCIVIAPAITCGSNLLICGCSIEVNCVSDIEINISLHQFRLISELVSEFSIKPTIEAQSSNFTYLIHNIEPQAVDLDQFFDTAKDSGVEILDGNSEISKSKDTSSQITEVSKFNFGSRSSDISQGLKYSNTISIQQNNVQSCPLEILLTGGQISLSLYKITKQKVIEKKKFQKNQEDTGYEASEEGSVVGMSNSQKVLPLLFILISQPNVYLQNVSSEQKINLSCYDVFIKTSEMQYSFIDRLPCQKDYQVFLMETKSGISDPSTGIPPAFVTLKWFKAFRKCPVMEINFGRPIRFHYSPSKLCHFLYIRNHILESFQDSYKFGEKSSEMSNEVHSISVNSDSYIKYKSFKTKFGDISNLCLKFSQIVLMFKTKSDLAMQFSLENLESCLIFLNRPERIINTITFKQISIGTNFDGTNKFLLNPWSGIFKISFFWESWQKFNSDPQIQTTLESDCLHFDVGPEQIKCVEAVIQECYDLISIFADNQSKTEINAVALQMEKDQYYKDDLRAGAFQFINASGNEYDLPLPYQVIFWNQTIVAMAWRYPQPRILTKVRVFPIPFKVTHHNSENQQVLCFLEYYSDCLGCYKTYTQFYLSESEICQLDLPKNIPQSAISSTWRVLLSFSDSKLNSHFVSPRALAACMRIDSYFNPYLIPRIQISVNLFSIKLSLFNQFNKNLALKMPERLRNYTPDGLIPDNECFLALHIENSNLFIASWPSDIATLDFTTHIRCCVLDYATLVMQPFIEPLAFKVSLNLAEHVNIDFLSEDINIKFNPAIGHTVAISGQLWSQNWLSNSSVETPDMIVVTQYVICNDTNLKLRFGQVGTDENILLPSRFLHLYCWRTPKYKREIKIGVEPNQWIWSKPLNIDKVTTETIQMIFDKNFCLLMTVKKLSATQKQVIFSGQLVVSNMLMDHFELKVIPMKSENKNLELKNAESYPIGGKTTAPSIVIDTKKKLALRIKFLTLESAWSGDVPLEENTKCSQPWLVKIPLQERGQFLSIWCRIVEEKSESNRILVMLWPLFMIRSNLPILTKVQIDTPVLNVHLNTSIPGQGTVQQLYCPGTIDHNHHLTFETENNSQGSNPYVPLNYSLVDHKDIFQKIETDNIDDILEFLNKYDESSWPYIARKLENAEWIAEEQSLTHIQVLYQTICQYSSSLLVEIMPWCLLLNTFGSSISVLVDSTEMCQVRHYGVISPPKLDNTFYIGLRINKKMYKSPLLQLARNDWSQSFYMPKINGVVPLEGNINIPVKCKTSICMMSIASDIVNDLRILQISSNYIVTNHTKYKLQLVCVALLETNKIITLPNSIMTHKITLDKISENNRNVGIPITNWHCIGEISDSEYSLHIIICAEDSDAISCPIRVDKSLCRKNVSLYSKSQNIPLIIIALENKGIIYLSIHHDIHPQLLIKNKCPKTIFFAQSDPTGNPIFENNCINWTASVKPKTEIYYTMPGVSERFPNLDANVMDKLIVAIRPSAQNNYEWSQEINMTIFDEQYIKIPNYCDIKLTIKKISYTILVTIDSATEVEISAQDIRSRLTKEYNQPSQKLKQSTDITDSKSSKKDKRKESRDKNGHGMKIVLKNYKTPNKEKGKYISLAAVLKSLVVTLTADEKNGKFEQIDIMTLTCDCVALTLEKNEGIECCISVADIQCDNKLFHRGFYDFPVVLLGEIPTAHTTISLNSTSIRTLIQEIRTNPDILINLRLEMWTDVNTQKNITEIQEIKVHIGPLLIYVEDTFIAKIIDYLNDLQPTQLVMWSLYKKIKSEDINSHIIEIPEHLPWEAEILAQPLNLQSLIIEQVSLLLSVHSSVKLYIALDRSPLQFSRFERKNIRTTSYQLGHALTMHYLSGAIFGAGWVVGSLELLGSPSGLARTVGSGLKDFISMPYHGLIQSPWAFLIGITHGSASLMSHIAAGTLDSVTKLASSVARNLDRLTLDEEHQRRVEEHRRQKPQGLAEGLVQGLTGLGISLLGAVGGIAHHTLQSVMHEGASPRGVLGGVGLGLVGVITKPLSGAAELVACTGQGLLQGAGWNPLPIPRIHSINNFGCALDNSILKYKWKILQHVTLHSNIILATEATFDSRTVVLLVTFEALVIIDADDDVIEKIIHLNEINSVEKGVNDFTEVRINLTQNLTVNPNQSSEPFDAEMDKISRARVAEYVRKSANVMQLSPVGTNEKFSFPVLSTNEYHTSHSFLIFYVVPQIRNYFCDILLLVKEQAENNTFKIL